MEGVPKWFSGLAEAIDWNEIDKESQEAFREQLIKLARKHIPLKADSSTQKTIKKAKLKMLNLMR